MEFIKEWISLTEAANNLKLHASSISKVCQNKQKTAGKFIWKFKNKNNNETTI